MKRKVILHKTESPAEQCTVTPLFTRMQVFIPTTPLAVEGITRVTMPRESRDVRYIRYIDHLTGVVRFVPADTACNLSDCDHGIEVVAKKDGCRRTYAQMPEGTEGVRYRRGRKKLTSVLRFNDMSK